MKDWQKVLILQPMGYTLNLIQLFGDRLHRTSKGLNYIHLRYIKLLYGFIYCLRECQLILLKLILHIIFNFSTKSGDNSPLTFSSKFRH